MPTTREYHSLAEVGHALQGRADRMAMASLFDRFDWYALLHQHCFAAAPVRVLAAEERRAQAWMVLMQPEARRVSALANWYSFAWAPIFVGDPDEAQQGRLLDALARHLLAGNSQIDFYPLEDGGALRASLRRAGWFALSRPMGGRYLLRPAGRDFATYWAARPGRLRTLVRRKARNSPYTLSISDRLTDDLWRDYVDVHDRSWKAAEPGLTFLRGAGERCGDVAAGLCAARRAGGGDAILDSRAWRRAHSQTLP